MVFILVLLLLVLGFTWLELPLKNWLIASVTILAVTMLTGITATFISLVIIVIFVGLLLLLYFLPDVRKQFVSARLFKIVGEMMPPISQTEQDAIDAGTVWWDAELFSGKPDWRMLFDTKTPELSSEEQAFMDGPVEQLCEMSDDWKITHELNDLPDEVWQFIKDNKFFGLNASKDFGGLGFFWIRTIAYCAKTFNSMQCGCCYSDGAQFTWSRRAVVSLWL